MFRKSLWLAVLPLALACAADKATDSKPQERDAKLVTEYKTPFGVSRADGKSVKAPEKSQPPSGVKVVEAGDSLRFEQPSPFGPRKWTRKKSELTEMEKDAWELSKTDKSPAPAKSKE